MTWCMKKRFGYQVPHHGNLLTYFLGQELLLGPIHHETTPIQSVAMS